MGDSIDSKTAHIRNHSLSGRTVKEVETTAYNTSPILYIMCQAAGEAANCGVLQWNSGSIWAGRWMAVHAGTLDGCCCLLKGKRIWGFLLKNKKNKKRKKSFLSLLYPVDYGFMTKVSCIFIFPEESKLWPFWLCCQYRKGQLQKDAELYLDVISQAKCSYIYF